MLCEYSTAKKAVASDYGLKPDRSAFGGLRSHGSHRPAPADSGFDVLSPDFIGHITAARDPVSLCPQVLAPVFFRKLANSASSLWELRTLRYCTARDTERLGGTDSSIWTWSRLIDPA
jgi:hypothetical protein